MRPWRLTNSAHLSEELQRWGYTIVNGGTNNHLILVNLNASHKIARVWIECVLALVCIARNKNIVLGNT